MGLPVFYPKSVNDLKKIEDWYFKSDESDTSAKDNQDLRKKRTIYPKRTCAFRREREQRVYGEQ